MLEGLVIFQFIVFFICDYYFSLNYWGFCEQYIVYFVDVFEWLLLVDSYVVVWFMWVVVEQFVVLYWEIDLLFCDILCEVVENVNFWQYFYFGYIQWLLEIIGFINMCYLDIYGLKDVCLLIVKIVDIYSSFIVIYSIMVGEIVCQFVCWMQLLEFICQ